MVTFSTVANESGRNGKRGKGGQLTEPVDDGQGFPRATDLCFSLSRAAKRRAYLPLR